MRKSKYSWIEEFDSEDADFIKKEMRVSSAFAKRVGANIKHNREALSYARRSGREIRNLIFGDKDLFKKGRFNNLWWFLYIIPVIGQLVLILRVRIVLKTYIQQGTSINRGMQQFKEEFYKARGIVWKTVDLK